MKISPILRRAENDMLLFWCPGCDGAHGVPVQLDGESKAGARWTWNGSVDKPTFAPSILVQHNHWHPPGAAVQSEVKDVCHSFVRDGQIQFLADCTHNLAGQTVPLPEFDV